MGFAAAITGALSIWLILWSVNVKGFDAFMVFLVIVLISATVKVVVPTLPGKQTPPGD